MMIETVVLSRKLCNVLYYISMQCNTEESAHQNTNKFKSRQNTTTIGNMKLPYYIFKFYNFGMQVAENYINMLIIVITMAVE